MVAGCWNGGRDVMHIPSHQVTGNLLRVITSLRIEKRKRRIVIPCIYCGAYWL